MNSGNKTAKPKLLPEVHSDHSLLFSNLGHLMCTEPHQARPGGCSHIPWLTSDFRQRSPPTASILPQLVLRISALAAALQHLTSWGRLCRQGVQRPLPNGVSVRSNFLQVDDSWEVFRRLRRVLVQRSPIAHCTDDRTHEGGLFSLPCRILHTPLLPLLRITSL